MFFVCYFYVGLCGADGIGIHTSFRNSVLGVRLPRPANSYLRVMELEDNIVSKTMARNEREGANPFPETAFRAVPELVYEQDLKSCDLRIMQVRSLSARPKFVQMMAELVDA